MKKKAAEKLAAKSAPVEEVAPVAEAPAEVVAEAPAEVVAEAPAEESAAE
jgi:small subunit ribosomal protein S16